MSIASVLRRYFGWSASVGAGTAYPYRAHVAIRTAPTEWPPRALYGFLKAAYLTNGFYDEVRNSWSELGYTPPNLKAIRSVVAPVVDVLGSKLYPDPLIVTTPRTRGIVSQVDRERAEANDPIKAAIDLVHTWSNWERARKKHARWVALYGESFRKVVADPEAGRVYFELIEPQYVTDYEMDVRDYITACRLDIPQTGNETDLTIRWTHVEAWDKARGSVRIWRADGDAAARRLEDLGPPVEEIPLSAFGIDFIPVVRSPFREIDDGRAIGAVQLAIEAIIESDLSATNLHSVIFNDLEGAWVLKSVGNDAHGRPLPPPVVGAASQDGKPGRQSDDTVQVGKRSFWRLPGNQELQPVVPDIDYAGALAILQDHDEHIGRLLPALSYLRIAELSGGDLSGKAITYKTRAFVDQVEECRANIVASDIQANMMALTMGQAYGIFSGLGSFETGDFEHDYAPQPILHLSSLDEAEEKRARAQAVQALTSASLPLSFVLTDILDLTEAEATSVIEQAADEAEANMERQQQLMAAEQGRQEDGEGDEDV